MKRILFGMIMLALALPAAGRAEAGVDVSIDFFYDNMESDGSWVELTDYGYCWQPVVAVTNVRWRPYSDGYWAYTDVGWTWISYEDFGWATYHYGRWVRLRDRGWFWVPGREWGPAWVSWRTGGDYVGWAPLPPRGGDEFVYEGSPISGPVDVEFDIGPSCYNFVDVRYIGEPVLRERIIEPHLNITYISNTVNVTNITYANSVVYNYGPDFDTLSQYSTRPIRRMTLERDTNVDLNIAAKSKGFTKVQGDKLIVAAPSTLQKLPAPIAPKIVKEKITKPTIERGWNDVSDPKFRADLKEKMKSEDPRRVPPPSVKPRDNAEVAQNPITATPAAPASGKTPGSGPAPFPSAYPGPPMPPKMVPSPATTPGKPGKGRGKDGRLIDVSPIPASVAPGALAPAMSPPGRARKERFPTPQPALTPSTSKMPGVAPFPVHSRPSSLATSPDGTPFREGPVGDDARKGQRTERAPGVMPPTRLPSEPLTEKAIRRPPNEPTFAPPSRQAPLPPDIQPKRPLPPERVAPPIREAPPEPPRKYLPPPERTLPPGPGPGVNAPARPEGARKGPDRKAAQPAPSPGP